MRYVPAPARRAPRTHAARDGSSKVPQYERPGSVAAPTGFVFSSLIDKGTQIRGLERQTPPFLCPSYTRIEAYALQFPGNVRITAVPMDAEFTMGPGTCRSTCKLPGNTLTVTRKLVFNSEKAVCDTAHFARVITLHQMIARDLRSQISCQ